MNGKGNFCPPNDASPRRVKTRQGTSPPAEDRASCQAAPPPFSPFLCFDGDGFSFHFGRFSFCHPAAPCAPPPTAQRPVPAFWIPRPRPPFTRRRGRGGVWGCAKRGQGREGKWWGFWGLALAARERLSGCICGEMRPHDACRRREAAKLLHDARCEMRDAGRPARQCRWGTMNWARVE